MVGKVEFLQPLARLACEGREVLSTVGWLSQVSEGFREAMLGLAIWRMAEPGTEFVHNGVEKGGMFAVVRGTVEVSLFLGHPDTRMVQVAGAGFWAGNRPLIGRTRQVSLVAREEVLWGFFPQTRIEQLLAEEPGWWKHIVETSDDGFMVAIGILTDLTIQDSRKRAIAILLRSAGCRYDHQPSGQAPFAAVSQSDLAAMAVMSRNTFNALMNSLRAEGLIDQSYRNIIISDPCRMRAQLED